MRGVIDIVLWVLVQSVTIASQATPGGAPTHGAQVMGAGMTACDPGT